MPSTAAPTLPHGGMAGEEVAWDLQAIVKETQ